MSKATNQNKIEFRETKDTNHGEKDSNGFKGKFKEKTDSELSHKDQIFGRGGGIIFDKDNNTHYNYNKTRTGLGGRSNGGRGHERVGHSGRGSGYCTATTGKTDIKNNIITVVAGTSTNQSQSRGIGSKGDMLMGSTGGGNNDDIGNGNGDRKGNEQREQKEQEGGGDDCNRDNAPNTQIKIIDPKDMIHKEFTISHHLSTYTNYESMDEVRKLTMEMQKKKIVFHPSNKYSHP